MIASQQIARRQAQNREVARPEEISGKVRLISFDVLVTEDEKNFRIGFLPAGKGRLLTTLCRVAVSKEGKPMQATITMGHEGFTNSVHVKTKPAVDDFSPAIKVGTSGMAAFGTFAEVSGYQYDSMQPIAVVMQTADPIPAGSEIHGTLFYAID